MLQFKPGSDGFAPVDNASEPLIASLFVPRIDKLVNIDGNLIIHSVLATKKARASSAAEVKRAGEETSLVLVKSAGLPCPIPRVRRNYVRQSQPNKDVSRHQWALSSGPANDFKPSTSYKSDGKLQE
ncbi:hypothetical protein Nepgr_013424 [Nepenthes gracilis]|uniref:Uncharacterized protein n=1 Tax=Nepenthes gracilis TaxID=150966 RepID=A0AAD3SHV5_NEPGR|nr:hypothetical protein Nepgr_013424 [Nepenthes gracilis]